WWIGAAIRAFYDCVEFMRHAGSAQEPLSVILRRPRITRCSLQLAPACAGLEGWRPQSLQLAPMQYYWGRRPPISGLPEIGLLSTQVGQADVRWLARPKEAGQAPQGDGDIDVLAAATRLVKLMDEGSQDEA